MIDNFYIIKKTEELEKYDFKKIIKAINKSAERVNVVFTQEELDNLQNEIESKLLSLSEDKIPVAKMHYLVECGLDNINPAVAKSYRDYRNYKKEFSAMMEQIFEASRNIRYIADKDNANTDSTLISTQRSLLLKKLSKEVYKKFQLTKEEVKDIEDGYYYIHDLSDRQFTMNCCLCDFGTIMDGGFEMANMWYTEPKTMATAMSVAADIAISAAAQQYGGFTLPEIDTVFEKYMQKSYDKHYLEYYRLVEDYVSQVVDEEKLAKRADDYAMGKLSKEISQGFQEWEYKFNTLSSSRGDYPFIAATFGLSKTRFGKLMNKICLKVRGEGQGLPGKKRPVLFPKLVFLYDENIHGAGKECEDVFNAAIECSSKCMYPDYLSVSADNFVGEMYKNYGRVISPMGCRAYLSPYWKNGGQHKLDEKDEPVFVGRFNIGAISLNLPMIYMKAKTENLDFYKTLDTYLEKIRALHKRTYEYLSDFKASTNPLMCCQGGFYGGHLKPSDRIEPLLDAATASFGITALNELQELYNGKELQEDSEFAYEVLCHINDKVDEFKAKDHHLYAIYGTPAESLCYTQVTQFRAKYGIVGKVGARSYFTNSFHMPVWADITPVQKQDLEYRFFHKMNGGHIQYCRYPNGKNKEAIKTIVKRAMDYGYYEGVNIEKNYCDDCGEQFDDGQTECPCCGSKNITQINRVCGYIGYSKVNGDTRMNQGKMEEIKDRKSM